MTAVAKHSWSAAFCVAAATSGLMWALPAEAGRVITASDSGNGNGLLSGTAQPNLFDCKESILFAAELVTGEFDCKGALAHRYDAGSHFGIIKDLVNSRRNSAWTLSDESVDVVRTNDLLTFNTPTQGDFVLVFSGDWLINPDPLALLTERRAGWSSYYLLEDVEIDITPFNKLLFSFNWTESGIDSHTRGLEVEKVSFYRINHTAVPEPSALALVGLALAGLVLASRRGRRASDPIAAAAVSPD